MEKEKDVTNVDGQTHTYTDGHSEYSVNPRLVDSDSQKDSTCAPLQLMEGKNWPYLYWVIRFLRYFFFQSLTVSLLTLISPNAVLPHKIRASKEASGGGSFVSLLNLFPITEQYSDNIVTLLALLSNFMRF